MTVKKKPAVKKKKEPPKPTMEQAHAEMKAKGLPLLGGRGWRKLSPQKRASIRKKYEKFLEGS